MKRKMYFALQLKRVLLKFPSILAVIIPTLVCTILAAAMILGNSRGNESSTKVSVGVVGNTTDTFFNIGIDVIKNIDDSRYYIDIISMSKQEAEESLSNEEIIGYVEVPENFIYSIAAMDNVPAVYYLPNKPESLGTALTKEVMDTVAVYITESQKVVAGLSDFIKSNGLKYGTSLDDISIDLMTNAILPRNNLYETEFTGVSDNLSTGMYYITGFLLFFMLLSGVTFSSVLIKKDRTMSKLLYSRGFGSIRQVICEYTVYVLILTVLFLILSVIFGIVAGFVDMGIRELKFVNAADCVFFILRIIPVILSICAMQFFMYEAVKGIVPAILLQFLTAVILGYLSGCFYPNYFFPESVRNIIELLPSGAGFTFMRRCVLSEFPIITFAVLIVHTFIFLAASVFIRRKRLAGDER